MGRKKEAGKEERDGEAAGAGEEVTPLSIVNIVRVAGGFAGDFWVVIRLRGMAGGWQHGDGRRLQGGRGGEAGAVAPPAAGG